MLKIEILEWALDHQPQCRNEWNLKILTKRYTFLRGGGNHICWPQRLQLHLFRLFIPESRKITDRENPVIHGRD